MAQIISFEEKKNQKKEKAEDQRILSEIKQKQKEMSHYGIGGAPTPDMSIDEYVTYLCSDLKGANGFHFMGRWGGFFKRHPEIEVADLIKEV